MSNRHKHNFVRHLTIAHRQQADPCVASGRCGFATPSLGTLPPATAVRLASFALATFAAASAPPTARNAPAHSAGRKQSRPSPKRLPSMKPEAARRCHGQARAIARDASHGQDQALGRATSSGQDTGIIRETGRFRRLRRRSLASGKTDRTHSAELIGRRLRKVTTTGKNPGRPVRGNFPQTPGSIKATALPGAEF